MAERSFSVMGFLIFYIITNNRYLRPAVGKCAKAILPLESGFSMVATINPFIACHLYIFHQSRNRKIWVEPEKYMNMIGHAVYGQQFILLMLYDAGYIFIQFVFPTCIN